MSDWSDLSEQLKKLGVRLGKDQSPPAKSSKKTPIESLVPGHEINTMFGSVFSSNYQLEFDHIHGSIPIAPFTKYSILCEWANAPHLADEDISDFIFIDTETTGLSGGTGTMPFMIGAGRFIDHQFVLEQFFLRNPAEEKAQLAALSSFVDGAKAIVSYNGKSFDLPIINTRYILNRLSNPFPEMEHVDLLHITRRVWKRRLRECKLGNIEREVLFFKRTGEDIPGYLVPEFYREYLVNGDGSQIAGIFYHNRIDVVSLSALFTWLAALLEDPSDERILHPQDLLSIGHLMERLDREELAERIYRSELLDGLNQTDRINALISRARLLKRNGKISEAIPLWKEAVEIGSVEAAVELAMYYEHNLKDYPSAIKFTESAISMLTNENSANSASKIMHALEHRKKRILEKSGKSVE